MYVRFDAPKKAVAGRMGNLLAHATIGPVSPAFPDVELTSFGLWERTDGIHVTVPSGPGGFLHLCPKMTKATITEEGGEPQVTLAPSQGGKAQLDKLCKAIVAVWNASPAIRLKPGERIELPPMNVSPASGPTAAPMQAPKK